MKTPCCTTFVNLETCCDLATTNAALTADDQPARIRSVFSSSNANPQGSGSARDGLVRVGSLRQGRSEDGAAAEQTGNPASSVSTSDKKQASVSDSLAAAMPGSFLTATDLQELARVYVVCLK